MDEVGELDLSDREQTVERHPDRDAHDARLGERGVDHPMLAELRHPAVGDAEDPAASADVLTEQDDAFVRRDLVVQRVADGGDDVLLGHASSANTCLSDVAGSGSGASHAAAMWPSISVLTAARRASCPASSKIPCSDRYFPNSTSGS